MWISVGTLFSAMKKRSHVTFGKLIRSRRNVECLDAAAILIPILPVDETAVSAYSCPKMPITSSGGFAPSKPSDVGGQSHSLSGMKQIHQFSTSTLRLDVYAGGDEPCAYATGLLINSGG